MEKVLMKKHLITVVALLVMSGSALAADFEQKGWYLGGGVGSAKFSDDDLYVSEDDSDVSYRLHGGYRILPWLAIEGRINNLGTYDTNLLDLKQDFGSFTGHAVFIYQINSLVALHLQAGAGAVYTEVGQFNDTGGTASVGAGIRLSPVRNFSVGVELDTYLFGVESSDEGKEFDQAVTTLQVTAQYNF
jgi:opacity protein-like surface antigen